MLQCAPPPARQSLDTIYVLNCGITPGRTRSPGSATIVCKLFNFETRNLNLKLDCLSRSPPLSAPKTARSKSETYSPTQLQIGVADPPATDAFFFVVSPD